VFEKGFAIEYTDNAGEKNYLRQAILQRRLL